MIDAEGNYVGGELELFKHAVNWKSYVARKTKKYIKGDVLEVGAGLGANAKYLSNGCSSYTFLEPDSKLCAQIPSEIKSVTCPTHVIQGISSDLSSDMLFDSIIYYDVMEHIEGSKDEFQRIQNHLKPGGHLIVLVPAYQTLYNEFDKAVGHFRRYNKTCFRDESQGADTLVEKKLFYLDSLGVVASFVNKWFLKQAAPSVKQVKFWDRTIVSLSKLLDPIVGHSFGKSLIGVLEKKNS